MKIVYKDEVIFHRPFSLSISDTIPPRSTYGKQPNPAGCIIWGCHTLY